ncbi:hypothetical protein [Prosthecobacter sp.]|uniref:hypothetical protein n=1 Tax=Prosthecobacter sp. TaxID=1965333 RepID=UPI001D5AE8A5|nr:hypothetical protein [Prosthecobacter sp.]MCB1278894.1 hypothetical protein [Prosthecobacter sp.]
MKFSVCFSAILLSASCLQAGDPDLPEPIDFSFADELLTRSPFTRTVNLQASLQLTGVAYVDGRPVATVLNTETKQRFVVSEEPNALGWRLVTASAGADLHLTQVEMQVGDEVIAMHYQGQQISPAGSVNGSKSMFAGSGKKDGGKIKTSSFLGEHGKEMYSSLSPEARDKFKELIRDRVEKHPELTPEQNADYARKVFARIKATDQPAAGGVVKTPKTSKKKQGA